MNCRIKTINLSNENKISVATIELPHVCPQCRIGIEAKPLSAYIIENKSTHRIYALFCCPACEMCFVGVYSIGPNFSISESDTRFEYTFPESKTVTNFSDEINELSPQFVAIYNQSENAENQGLSQICGLGYRKALEFLIKDYAIRFHPQDEECIKRLPLAKCIEKYVDNLKIQTVAKASAWLGNDEAHYVRKHEDYDLKHLKTFIKAAVSYVNSELSLLIASDLLNKSK